MKCPCGTEMEIEGEEGNVTRYKCPKCGRRGMRGKRDGRT